MGKKDHSSRGGSNGKKASALNPADDTAFIVFSNDNESSSSKTKAKAKTKSKQESPAIASEPKAASGNNEPIVKKPDVRTLIGGASWTGKLPMNLLSEHCQKQKWEKPEYTMARYAKTQDGFISTVLLKKKDPKTHEVTNLPPVKLPQSHKHLGIQPSAIEARHFAAAYTLFRISSMKNIHVMLPPAYRDLWKGEFQVLKDEDCKTQGAWLYEADPFSAQKLHEDKLAERKQEMKSKATTTGQSNKSLPENVSRGWKSAPKAEMGLSMRRQVESLVRTHGVWNLNSLQLGQAEKSKILKELTALGFRASHVEEAFLLCGDKEEVLEWLLVHVPEDDLPAWTFPEGYFAGVSVADTNIKRDAAVKRLSSVGYAIELCRSTYDARQGNELLAASDLQHALLGKEPSAEPTANAQHTDKCDNSIAIWNEEQEVVKSIFAERYEIDGFDSCRLQLDVNTTKEPIFLIVRRPSHAYPQMLPLLAIESKIPAYIRLSILQQALTYAETELLGECMILSLVNWVEEHILSIIENPGKLAKVSAVATSVSSNSAGKHEFFQRQAHRKPRRAVHIDARIPSSRKLLSDWEEKQNDPQQRQMLSVRQSLPAWNLREDIIRSVNANPVTIISGETGSGKSTQAVQFILDDFLQRRLGATANIICTQPRRISALGLADRVAEERCGNVGQEVGYSIRGDSKRTHGITKITFVTTGVLLRQLQMSTASMDDNVAALADVSHVIVDEVHERSLDTDFLLALLKRLMHKRKTLKLVLMSATLDASMFEDYFGGSKNVGRVNIEGRTYPVQDLYVDDVVRMVGYAEHEDVHSQHEFEQDKLGKAIQKLGTGINYKLIAALVQQIDSELGPEKGGILIFLPGTLEITRTIDALRSFKSIHPLPLHASLLPADQKKVFPPAPIGKRKVVVATNVAETSITIQDIVAVIDTGRVKETKYDISQKVVKLEEVWASRAACKQRRGRAGRVRAGSCYKLYTRNTEARMADRPDPEITRVPLEQLCLSVKAMGIASVPEFLAETLTPPDTLAIQSALNLLVEIGALEANVLTALGKHLAMIPADLRCSKLMVYGAIFGCFEACVTIASILTARSPFVNSQERREEVNEIRQKYSQDQGDLLGDLHAYDTWTEQLQNSSPREVREWCNERCLSMHTLNEIASARMQYLSTLKEIGLIPFSYHSRNTDEANLRYNRNSSSLPLLRAMIAGSFSPQIARVQLPEKKYLATISGAKEIDPEARTIKYFTKATEHQTTSETTSNESETSLPTSMGPNMRVFIHPSSTVFHAKSFPSNAAFISYFSLISTSKLFVRDITPCSAYGLLLLGGTNITIDLQGRGMTIDGWARVRGWARIGVLVGRLRRILDAILERWIESPGGSRSAQGSEAEDTVVTVVRRLIDYDGLDL